MLIKDNWKFHLEDLHFDSHMSYWDKGYDDRSWQAISIPYDWSVHYPFSEEHSSGTGYLPGGIGWYRGRLKLKKEDKGKRIKLRFEGVYKRAMVWCNSYYCGEWANGYTPFEFDITDMASFGEDETLIVVKVRHADIADSRWFTGSGIFRNVYVDIIDPTDLIEGSLVIHTDEVTKERAVCHASFEIDSVEDKDDVLVESDLLDRDGRQVAYDKKNMSFKTGEIKQLKFLHQIVEPNLWSDDNPVLYTHVIRINGQVKKRTAVGIRAFHFDPDTGFYINGINKKLKGVCLHHDAGALGAAVPKEVWRRRLFKLKELGCNAIRGSHNTHSRELYDLCDEMGFYFIDELFDEWEGPKNKWSTGHNVYPPKHQGYFEDFHTWCKKDIEAVIRWNRNHPSIIMWSLGNEIDYPNDPYCHPMFKKMTGNNDNNKPEQERLYKPTNPNAERIVKIAKDLKEEVLKYDKTRPISMALAYPEVSREIGLIEVLDVIGYNYKEEHYESDHKRYPDKPFLGSENGHQYDVWKTVVDCDYISGQFLWTGIDFLGEAHGWPIRGSNAGLLTTAGFEKAEYFYRKALWSHMPVMEILTRREGKERNNMFRPLWRYSEGEFIHIRIFTNSKDINLKLNGAPVKGLVQTESGYECLAEYHDGKLVCEGTYQGESLVNELHTPLEDLIIEAKTWELDTGFSSKYYYEEEDSIWQVEVNLKDRNGSIVVDRDLKIHVELEGQGKILAIDNGDLKDMTAYNETYRKTYEGKLIVYVKEANDDTVLKLSGPNLDDVQVSRK